MLAIGSIFRPDFAICCWKLKLKLCFSLVLSLTLWCWCHLEPLQLLRV